MSDELQRELRTERGYTAILEGILSERRPPRNPYVIFDNTGIIRFVSPSFENVFCYKPEQVIGKKYQDFISPDLYESALRELAYRIDVVRESPEKFNLEKFIGRFKKDFVASREALSREEKVANIERRIRAYDHKQTPDVEMHDSEVRVRLGDGRCVTVKDKFWLRKHKTEHGWEYAASMVEFDASEVNPSYFTRFRRWVASWSDLKPYTITDEPVIAINSFDEATEISSLILKLIDSDYRKSKLVLDFREVGEAKDKAPEEILRLVTDLSKTENVIIGNAQEKIRSAMSAYVEKSAKESKRKPYQLHFHRLVYPSVKTPVVHGPESIRELKNYAELEKYVEEGIRELEAFANKVPEQGVRPVQEDTAGKGGDVRGDGKSAGQQS